MKRPSTLDFDEQAGKICVDMAFLPGVLRKNRSVFSTLCLA